MPKCKVIAHRRVHKFISNLKDEKDLKKLAEIKTDIHYSTFSILKSL